MEAPSGESGVCAEAMKLLVADDDSATRVGMVRMIEKWGYRVEEAADGKQAWRLLTGGDPPRIALLDWIMPELDGLDICGRLAARTNAPLIYVILVTSKTGKEDVVKGLDSGAHDFLTKPVDASELKSRIAVGKRLIQADTAMRDALAQISTLHGLLPICANCKKVREDDGYWTQIESYLGKHAGSEFTHGICPECAEELYANVEDEGYSA